MINSNKIKGRMKELEILQADVAKKLGVAEVTACQKINGKRPMSVEEAVQLADMLRINNAEFGDYFFMEKVAQRNR